MEHYLNVHRKREQKANDEYLGRKKEEKDKLKTVL